MDSYSPTRAADRLVLRLKAPPIPGANPNLRVQQERHILAEYLRELGAHSAPGTGFDLCAWARDIDGNPT